MQAAGHIRNSVGSGKDRSIVPGLVLMGLALIISLFALLFVNGSFESYPFLFLLPWLFGLAVVMAIPMIILYYQGRFTFVDPLVFSVLSHFFPAYVVGGLFFAVGLSQPSFTSFIQDPHVTLPMTVVLVGLGYIGLAAGYLLPIGAKLGALTANRLPLADYSPKSLIFPSILLLLSGIMITIFTLILGRFGYQRAGEVASYDGLVFFTTLFWAQAGFMLWSIIFRQKKWDFIIIPIILLLAITSLTKFLYSGSRGNIIQIFLIVTFAFIFSGRRFSVKQGAIAAILLTIGLTIGMIYGTTFRNVKGSEESQSAEKYTENIFQTVDQVGKSDVYNTLIFGAVNFTERVDVLSTLAVVVSSHEQLKPYEEAYGLDDNIWNEMSTFMIPRVIWPDKPVVSDARRYSDLYFNYGGSSYAVTPVGDLLRNYGIVGIPIGMFVLGLILRFTYRSLVEGQSPVIWRLTLYFMLLASVSYEGFYGTIIPVLFKIGLTTVIGILFVNVIAKRIDKGNLAVR
jgi:hypothetical protein